LAHFDHSMSAVNQHLMANWTVVALCRWVISRSCSLAATYDKHEKHNVH